MAGKKPLLRIGGDVGEARKALAELKSDAKDFDRIRAEARVTVETAAAKVKLDQLNANLTRLAAQEYTPKVALEEGRVTAQIARVEEKLRKLAAEAPEVKLKVKLDEEQAKRAVEVRQQLFGVDLQRAKLAAVANLLQSQMDEEAAKADEERLRRAQATLDAGRKAGDLRRAQAMRAAPIGEDARVSIRTEAAQAKLDALHVRLIELGRESPSLDVKIETGKVLAEIELVEERLRRLDGRDVKVKVKVDGDSVERTVKGLSRAIPTGAGGGFFSAILSGVASTVASIGSLSGAVGKGVSSLAALVPVIGESAAGFIGLGAAMLTAIPLLGLFAAGITLVIGVLGALAASFAAAVAGAAVLAAGLGGALLGPIAIAIAAFAKLISMFKAFGAEQKASQTNAQAAQAAALQQASAQQTLSDAYANLANQTRAARDAQVAATEAVKDDIRTRAGAKIDIDQAKLDTKKAQQALADFKAPGAPSLNGAAFQKFTDVNVDESKLKGALAKAGAAAGATSKDSLELQQLIINVRKAKQAEKEANDRLHDSNTKLAQDRRTEGDFLTKGLAAYPGYVSALHQVRNAQDAVRRATVNAAKAQEAQGKGLEDLNPKERHLADTLRGVAKSFKDLFSPAVDKALDGLVHGLKILAGVAKDPEVKEALSGIGDALRGAFIRIALFLSNKESRQALVNFLNSGKKLIRPLTDLFIAVGKTVRDLAQDALPYLEKKFKSFAKALNSLTGGKKTQTITFGFVKFNIPDERTGAQRFKGTVDGLIHSFENFVKIGKGLSSIILAFFRAGKKEGDKLTGSLGDALVKYGKFLNSPKGQAGIKGFFRDVRNIVKDLALALEKFLGTLKKVPAAVRAVNRSFGDAKAGGLRGLGGLPFLLPKTILDSLLPGAGKAAGGPVFGSPSGHDNVLTPLSGGEYVIRRSVVDALGLPFLNALNASGNPRSALAGGGGGGTTHITNNNHFHTPGGVADPRVAAAQLSRELARRAG